MLKNKFQATYNDIFQSQFLDSMPKMLGKERPVEEVFDMNEEEVSE